MRPSPCSILVLLLAGAAHGNPERPLTPLPADKLAGMPPLLRHGDVALIESDASGQMKQVTVMTLVAAPPELLRKVLMDLEHYPDFVRNLKRSKVTRNPDGTADQELLVDYTVTDLHAVFRWRALDDGAYDVRGIDPNNETHYRWELQPVPRGTLLVLYGYTDVVHTNKYLTSITQQVPPMAHGLALAGQMVELRAMKLRAEALAGPGAGPPGDPGVKAAGFNFLLERGLVAVMRTDAAGKLTEFSVLDRIRAPRGDVEAAIMRPAAYAEFMSMVKESRESSKGPSGAINFWMKMSLPLVSWEGRFGIMRDPQGAIDVVGTDGDLRSAHYRWDLTPSGERLTLAVLRARQNLGASSFFMRALFQKEPLFEHGINVALGVVMLSGIKARAEKLK